jgi:hypothetical protein
MWVFIKTYSLITTLTFHTVDAADADVVFKSKDGILFRIHLKNLETGTGKLPPDGVSTGEIIELPEISTVLEDVFAFIYPRRHPLLAQIQMSHLVMVAEAAEIYEVFAAMSVCYLRMRYNRIGIRDKVF